MQFCYMGGGLKNAIFLYGGSGKSHFVVWGVAKMPFLNRGLENWRIFIFLTVFKWNSPKSKHFIDSNYIETTDCGGCGGSMVRGVNARCPILLMM